MPLDQLADSDIEKFVQMLAVLIRELDTHLNAIKVNPDLRNNVVSLFILFVDIYVLAHFVTSY